MKIGVITAAVLKTLVFLNNLCLLFGCYRTYQWWPYERFYYQFYAPHDFKDVIDIVIDAFDAFFDGALVEEIGLITFLMSVLLSIAILFSKHVTPKKIWLTASLFPIALALTIIIGMIFSTPLKLSLIAP